VGTILLPRDTVDNGGEVVERDIQNQRKPDVRGAMYRLRA
jgi:hypothetical protein